MKKVFLFLLVLAAMTSAYALSCEDMQDAIAIDYTTVEAEAEFETIGGYQVALEFFYDSQESRVKLGSSREEPMLLPGKNYSGNPEGTFLIYTKTNGEVHLLEIADLDCGVPEPTITIEDATTGYEVASDESVQCTTDIQTISLGSLGSVSLRLTDSLIQFISSPDMGHGVPRLSNGATLTFSDNSIQASLEGVTTSYTFEYAGGMYYSSICDEPARCTDTDGGKYYYVKGAISAASEHSEDYCTNSVLYEYYCVNNELQATTYSCPNGCSDGRCIRETCSDTDGGVNVDVIGTCTDSRGTTVNDACLTENGASGGEVYVKEAFCMTDAMREYCKQFNGDEYCENLPTHCYSSSMLPNPNLAWSYFPMQESYICDGGCEDGKCVSCTDTDGGMNLYEKGTCTGSNGQFTDSCNPNVFGRINEAYCLDSGDCHYVAMDDVCPYGCEDGRCINVSERNCDNLEEDNPQYFAGCSEAGFGAVCFDKYTGEYMGCTDTSGNGCTSSNLHQERNMFCRVEQTGCTDSDSGLNYYIAGEAQGSNGLGTVDYCSFTSDTMGELHEAYCDGDTAKHQVVDCPSSAPYCNRGICSSTRPVCTDTDGGTNIYSEGTITEPRYEDGPQHTDYCQNLETKQPWNGCEGPNCGIREYYCQSPYRTTTYTDVACPQGCDLGECAQAEMKCIFSSGIDCLDFSWCGDTHILNMVLMNNVGQKIDDILLDIPGCTAVRISEPVDNRGRFDVAVKCSGINIGVYNEYDATLTYDVEGSNIRRSATGEISGAGEYCSQPCERICRNIGTRSEGWYDSCTNQLIQYADCGSTSAYKTKGSSNAAVELIMFGDMECPYCARFYNTVLPGLESQYIDAGKLRFTFRHFPLQFRQYAYETAVAAECAADQNRFFDYLDMVYVNQDSLESEDLLSYARTVGLDMDKFEYCIGDDDPVKAVENDIDYGQEKGVTGTPTFYLNGEEIRGAAPLEQFQQKIDALIGSGCVEGFRCSGNYVQKCHSDYGWVNVEHCSNGCLDGQCIADCGDSICYADEVGVCSEDCNVFDDILFMEDIWPYIFKKAEKSTDSHPDFGTFVGHQADYQQSNRDVKVHVIAMESSNMANKIFQKEILQQKHSIIVVDNQKLYVVDGSTVAWVHNSYVIGIENADVYDEPVHVAASRPNVITTNAIKEVATAQKIESAVARLRKVREQLLEQKVMIESSSGGSGSAKAEVYAISNHNLIRKYLDKYPSTYQHVAECGDGVCDYDEINSCEADCSTFEPDCPDFRVDPYEMEKCLDTGGIWVSNDVENSCPVPPYCASEDSEDITEVEQLTIIMKLESLSIRINELKNKALGLSIYHEKLDNEHKAEVWADAAEEFDQLQHKIGAVQKEINNSSPERIRTVMQQFIDGIKEDLSEIISTILLGLSEEV